MKKDYIKPQISITSLRPEERIAGVVSDDAREEIIESIKTLISPGITTGRY